MFHRFNSRRLLGTTLMAAGSLTIAGTLVLTTPGTPVAAAGSVFLVIQLSDSASRQFPTGSTVTVTANLSNSSISGNGAATPTVTVSYSTGVLSFVSQGSGWSCSTASGVTSPQICTDGTISLGGTGSLPLVFAVTGVPANGATVTATVNGGDVGNQASFSGSDSATDSATVANGASYVKDVPGGAYPSKVGQDQVVADDSQSNTFTYTDGSTTIKLNFPPQSLLSGTHVSVYRANSTYWNGSLSSSSQGFVDGYAAAWTGSGSSTGSNAGGLVTMVVVDPSVKTTDTLYRATTTGIGTRTGVIANGAWTVSFTEDPGFVMAQAAAAPSTTTAATTSSTAAAAPISAPAAGGGAPVQGGGATLPMAAGVGLLLAGAVVVSTGRRREQS